eukprot:TRINITY_DN7550_c0_g1_i1.p1 TRINITY_DN7550_c0_g1~~TRINITY_DN7550_c0_g1_i1.p1  ORF type:complete len:359 (+),score=52.15 TRINITY_DN7550_c0_g1_i1:94-1170(+)
MPGARAKAPPKIAPQPSQEIEPKSISHGTFKFSALLEEIQSMVISYLELEDRLSIKNTCKRMRTLTFQHLVVMISFSMENSDSKHQLLAISRGLSKVPLDTLPPCTLSVSIDGPYQKSNIITSEALQKFEPILSSTVDLYISSLTAKGAKAFYAPLRNLRKIRIGSAPLPNPKHFSLLVSLRRIHFYAVSRLADFMREMDRSGLPNVEHVHIEFGYPHVTFGRAFHNMPKLRHLNLSQTLPAEPDYTFPPQIKILECSSFGKQTLRTSSPLVSLNFYFSGSDPSTGFPNWKFEEGVRKIRFKNEKPVLSMMKNLPESLKEVSFTVKKKFGREINEFQVKHPKLNVDEDYIPDPRSRSY